MKRAVVDALHEARAAEKEQALFYRGLAAQAEAAGDAVLAERLDGLHADEQHHLSRLTARLLELGERLADLRGSAAPSVALDDWQPVARERERAEALRYRQILELAPDPVTAELVREILRVEEIHEEQLGGKWMRA
ncbi:MAG TPA: ferritin-like domain-containing protein [Longimicrobiales bacterium]